MLGGWLKFAVARPLQPRLRLPLLHRLAPGVARFSTAEPCATWGDLHVREETLILEAEAEGLDVDRRGDAGPAIVLTTTRDAV